MKLSPYCKIFKAYYLLVELCVALIDIRNRTDAAGANARAATCTIAGVVATHAIVVELFTPNAYCSEHVAHLHALHVLELTARQQFFHIVMSFRVELCSTVEHLAPELAHGIVSLHLVCCFVEGGNGNTR